MPCHFWQHEHLARKNHNKTEKWIINLCIIYRIPKIQEKLNTFYLDFGQKIPYTWNKKAQDTVYPKPLTGLVFTTRIICWCPFCTSGFVEWLSRNFQQQTRPRYQWKTANATDCCSPAVDICQVMSILYVYIILFANSSRNLHNHKRDFYLIYFMIRIFS